MRLPVKVPKNQRHRHDKNAALREHSSSPLESLFARTETVQALNFQHCGNLFWPHDIASAKPDGTSPSLPGTYLVVRLVCNEHTACKGKDSFQ